MNDLEVTGPVCQIGQYYVPVNTIHFIDTQFTQPAQRGGKETIGLRFWLRPMTGSSYGPPQVLDFRGNQSTEIQQNLATIAARGGHLGGAVLLSASTRLQEEGGGGEGATAQGQNKGKAKAASR